MELRIPASVADVQPAHAGDLIVNDDHLGVVRPKVRLLAAQMVWMTKDLDILVQLFQSVFRVRRAK